MKPLRFVPGWMAVAVLTVPSSLSAQWPALAARVGYAWRSDAPCSLVSRERGLTLGVEARSRGSWVVSGALDLLLNSYGCLDIGYQTTYDGQRVDIEGSQSWGRARVALGHTLDVAGIHSSLTLGAGLIPASMDGLGISTDITWQPWYGGALTVQVPGSRIGVELELGRHRVPQRYYAESSDVLVAEIHRWERFTRLGIAFPF